MDETQVNDVLKEQEVKEEVKIKGQQDYVDDFDGFGDDCAGCISFLIVLRLRGYSSRHVA